eukprot:scaffold97093_cov26-Tisochrysis_lutea.AAC.3
MSRHHSELLPQPGNLGTHLSLPLPCLSLPPSERRMIEQKECREKPEASEELQQPKQPRNRGVRGVPRAARLSAQHRQSMLCGGG